MINDSIRNESNVLSIIIPIYNAEKNLKKCINSLQKLGNRNIEIILVNDGSTDNSSLICEEIVKNDNRFSLYNKDNGGVSSARNYGLRIATGKYIYFMDSDDYINSEKFSGIIKCLNQDVESLYFLYSRDCSTPEVKELIINKINRQMLAEKLKNADFFNDFGYVWNKIYKKEIIVLNNIVFEEGILEREDLLFNIDYFKNVNDVIFYEDYIYHYIQYEESLSRKGKSSDFINNFVQLLEEKLKDNYLSGSISKGNIVLTLIADYIVKSIFFVYESYKDIKNKFIELLVYKDYIYHSNPHNLYLRILKYCFRKNNIYPLYVYYKLSSLKKKIRN